MRPMRSRWRRTSQNKKRGWIKKKMRKRKSKCMYTRKRIGRKDEVGKTTWE
jgi:hypothetical protein